MFFLVTEYTIKHPIKGRRRVEDVDNFDTKAEMFEYADEVESPDEIVRAFELLPDNTWIDHTKAALERVPEADPYAGERLDAFTQGCGRWAL